MLYVLPALGWNPVNACLLQPLCNPSVKLNVSPSVGKVVEDSVRCPHIGVHLGVPQRSGRSSWTMLHDRRCQSIPFTVQCRVANTADNLGSGTFIPLGKDQAAKGIVGIAQEDC